MKDAYYFSHDANARHDPKILSMRSVYGSEGYGWYWIIIEMLREQENFKIEITKYVWNALAMQTQSNADAMHQFVDDCINEFNLFASDGAHFWSDSLKRRMEMRTEKSEKARKAAEARWGKARNNSDSAKKEDEQNERNADAMQTQCDSNALKERKVKEKKDDMYANEFAQFWSIYPRKLDKKRASTKFKSVRKQYSLEAILEGTKKYAEQVKNTEKQFIKHPTTFLNNESFIDGYEEKSKQDTSAPTNPRYKEFAKEDMMFR